MVFSNFFDSLKVILLRLDGRLFRFRMERLVSRCDKIMKQYDQRCVKFQQLIDSIPDYDGIFKLPVKDNIPDCWRSYV